LRPALYELRSNHTLADVVNMAGGALPEGYLSSVSVKRVTESGVKQFSLDMTQASGQNFRIKMVMRFKLRRAMMRSMMR
jgi:SLBB domain.